MSGESRKRTAEVRISAPSVESEAAVPEPQLDVPDPDPEVPVPEPEPEVEFPEYTPEQRAEMRRQADLDRLAPNTRKFVVEKLEAYRATQRAALEAEKAEE